MGSVTVPVPSGIVAIPRSAELNPRKVAVCQARSRPKAGIAVTNIAGF
jgi:hypothetical protein